MTEQQEYWAIYKSVMDMLRSYDLLGDDKFIHKCVMRVEEDADDNWNEDDVRIAIRNTLNELIESMTAKEE